MNKSELVAVMAEKAGLTKRMQKKLLTLSVMALSIL